MAYWGFLYSSPQIAISPEKQDMLMYKRTSRTFHPQYVSKSLGILFLYCKLTWTLSSDTQVEGSLKTPSSLKQQMDLHNGLQNILYSYQRTWAPTLKETRISRKHGQIAADHKHTPISALTVLLRFAKKALRLMGEDWQTSTTATFPFSISKSTAV